MHRNAPSVIAFFLAVFSILGLLVVTLFVSNALLRDFDLNTDELIFSSPIKRRHYLLGRIGAALIASLMMYVVIAIGTFVAQFMPWIDSARLGPVSLRPYVWSFCIMLVPNLLFATALLSLLAVVTRSILWVYIGVIAFFVLYFVSGSLLADVDNRHIVALLDPFGLRPLGLAMRYWLSLIHI